MSITHILNVSKQVMESFKVHNYYTQDHLHTALSLSIHRKISFKPVTISKTAVVSQIH